MNKIIFKTVSFFLFSILISCSAPPKKDLLFDFKSEEQLQQIKTDKGAAIEITDKQALQLHFAEAEKMPSVTFQAPDYWDFSEFLFLTMEVSNPGEEESILTCRMQGDVWNDAAVIVPPGKTVTFNALLKQEQLPAHIDTVLFAMNGRPGGIVGNQRNTFQTDSISHFTFISPFPLHPHKLIIDNIRLTGSIDLPSQEELAGDFMPFIDEFGQYKHGDWKDKIQDESDFKTQTKKEAADLKNNPEAADWSKYGGWSKGPKLEATGHFRVEKVNDKWSFIDPEGYPFWSHGIDCVRKEANTPVTDREHYFSYLPERSEENEIYFGQRDGSPKGYFRNKPFTTFDYRRLNLNQKYGADWNEKFIDITHQRLRSWGINTIANWSDADIYMAQRTPYTGTLHSNGKKIQGSIGQWGKFPDPFDKSFTESLESQFKKHQSNGSCDDSWSIGFFIDNEMHWGDSTFLAECAIASPADQAARIAVIDLLKKKYKTLKEFNPVWKTEYMSWEEIKVPSNFESNKQISSDLSEATRLIAGEYFSNCRMILKKYAPNKLYLGCRLDFHFYPFEESERAWVQKVAAKYCDVISYNRYRFTATELVPPKGIDKPIIIGEFHFGALDRGKFHPGLRAVNDQEQRAAFYAHYVRSALENPYIVGTHWFQYSDSATTGRFDGENYQIGFLDVCDTPYWETIEACRKVGYQLYELRF